MGRLTLNILLSFAQFEREVIAERIRDKMSASRKKGKWVGGRPPFGYDVDYRAKKLIVNETEARWVRWLFDRFIQSRSTTVIIRELAEQGVTTKSWTTKNGSDITGKPWDRGAVYKALANRTYLGQVDYKGTVYDGEQAAIIDQRTWDEVHAILAEAPQARANRDRVVSNRAAANPAFLVGLVRCANCGSSMSPSFTRGKNGAFYRYYRCQSAQKNGAEACQVGSVPAGDLEKEVLGNLRRIFQSPEVLAATSRAAKTSSAEGGLAVDHQAVIDALRKIDAVWDELYPGEQTRIAALLLDHIKVGLERVTMSIKTQGVEHLLGDRVHRPGDDGLSEVVLMVECRRRCGRTRLVSPGDASQDAMGDPDEKNEIVEALARGFTWQEELESGVIANVSELARREGFDEGYVRRMLNLALCPSYLATRIAHGTETDCDSVRALSRQCGSVAADSTVTQEPKAF
jgi:site-specific DNA recombinase